MTFINGQEVILKGIRFDTGKRTMTVLGQVKDQVALYNDYEIEVFHIYKEGYLTDHVDGGPSQTYKVTFIEK